MGARGRHRESPGSGPRVPTWLLRRPVSRALGDLAAPATGDGGQGPGIMFARSGLTVRRRDDVASLLDLAEAYDVPTRWSCRTSVCPTCEAGSLTGTVSHHPPPVDVPAEGHLLLCCAAPAVDVVIDIRQRAEAGQLDGGNVRPRLWGRG